MRHSNLSRGFSLLELLIAVTVLAILLAIALPAYTNYSVRAKVSECLNLAATARMAVSDRVARAGFAPETSEEAGYRFAQTEYCDDIYVADGGAIVVETRNTGASEDPVVQYELNLDTALARVDWDCEFVSGDPAHVPASCRAQGTAATGGGDSDWYQGGSGGSTGGGSTGGGSNAGGSNEGGSNGGGSNGGGSNGGGSNGGGSNGGGSNGGGSNGGGSNGGGSNGGGSNGGGSNGGGSNGGGSNGGGSNGGGSNGGGSNGGGSKGGGS
jgi:prepilin-type N-terminal cleavage/methylation domain-containing protein